MAEQHTPSIFIMCMHVLENYYIFFYLFTEKSKLGLDSNCIKLKKYLSKSTSELSNNEVGDIRDDSSQNEIGGNQNAHNVLQRTHGFFSNLKVFLFIFFCV